MSKQRKKGTAWETALLDPLRTLWVHVGRTGSADQGAGDFRGTGRFLVEAKNTQSIPLADFVDQAQRAALGTDKLPTVIIKRRQRAPLQAYVVMPLWAWLQAMGADQQRLPLPDGEDEPSDA